MASKIRSSGARNKGYIKDLSSGETKYFMFNPTTFSEQSTVNYNTVNGIGGAYPLLEYSGGSTNSIPLEIFLKGDKVEVKEWIKWLKRFVPDKSKKTSFSPPPMLQFALGEFSAKCVMTSISFKYSEFDEDLNPIEALASVTLVEVV